MKQHHPVPRAMVASGLSAVLIASMAVGCSKTDDAKPVDTGAGSTTSSTAAPGGGTTVPAGGGTSIAPKGTTVSTPGAVLIKDYKFTPKEQTAKVGETITWTNEDEFPHYVISDAGGTELDSGDMANGATYTKTFDTAGTYAYHCNIHSGMKGTIVVS